MKEFIHEDFMLGSGMARRLYHEFAEQLPIVDYHNHLDAEELAEDRTFENITEVWIAGDPYKHRAMRIAGVPERLITGDASDREKFDAWAGTVPKTLGNPLFHWTALELKRYFGITRPLSSESADHVWDTCNALLHSADFSARRLIARANVECLCTSNGPGEALVGHARLANGDFRTRVLPSLRMDGAEPIGTETIAKAFDQFETMGCLLADCAVDDFASKTLWALGGECGRRGWVLQLHIGAQRHTSSRLRRIAGPAGGYATIGGNCDIPGLCGFLDGLEKEGCLPRTILYPSNPADFAALAAVTGSFVEEGVAGKVQLGPAWWYNDHATGIRSHLDALASHGLLATFVGMTTDSRSILSMARHEYFRRILCDWLGDQIEAGEMPGDLPLIGQLVRSIAHDSARAILALD